MLGAGCITLLGPASAFVFDGLTFFISAAFLIAIRFPVSLVARPSQSKIPADFAEESVLPERSSNNIGGALRDMREGLRYVFAHTWLWVLVLASPLVSVGFAGPMWVSLPRLVRDVYGAGVWLIGAMATSDAVGSIIAALFIGNASKLRRRGIVAFTSIMVGGCALVACAVPLSRSIEPVVAIIASALVG